MTWVSRLFPCRGCEAKDEALAAAAKREESLMSEIRNLTDKLSAQVDADGHAAFVRGERWREGPQEPRERKPPAVRIPAWGQRSISKGHIKLNSVRQLVKDGPRPDLPSVAEDPLPGD